MYNKIESLANKYRPVRIEEFLGNKEAMALIDASLRSKRIDGWSMLLISGPPGVGKTSLALSIQRYLICRNNSICGECLECKDFIRWSRYESMGDPRILANFDTYMNWKFVHPYGIMGIFEGTPDRKIEIWDEAHNVSKREFEVRKKYFESGDKVCVILVTSEPSSIPNSIKSICAAEITLEPPDAEEIAVYLMKIARAEGVAVDADIEARIHEIASRKPRDVRAAVYRLETRIIAPFRAGMKLIGPSPVSGLVLPDQSRRLAVFDEGQQICL